MLRKISWGTATWLVTHVGAVDHEHADLGWLMGLEYRQDCERLGGQPRLAVLGYGAERQNERQ